MPTPTTMRALQLRTLTGGDGLVIADVAAPSSDTNVIIEVHAAGIGFPDLLMTKGQYQFKPVPPFIPGVEAAGVVLRAPASSGVQPGDRVSASSMLGAWAEIAGNERRCRLELVLAFRHQQVRESDARGMHFDDHVGVA